MKYLKSILRVFSLAYSKIKASPKLFALPLLAILMLIQKYLQSKGIGSI
jgi:ABC-type maltose transport system permease subunit